MLVIAKKLLCVYRYSLLCETVEPDLLPCVAEKRHPADVAGRMGIHVQSASLSRNQPAIVLISSMQTLCCIG